MRRTGKLQAAKYRALVRREWKRAQTPAQQRAEMLGYIAAENG